MTRADQRDVVLIAASLTGVVVGRWLRDARSPTPPSTEGPALTASSAAAGASAIGPSVPAPPLVGVSSLFAAATLSRQIGQRLSIGTENIAGHAVLAFAISAGLTYYADTLARYLPGLRPTRAGETRP